MENNQMEQEFLKEQNQIMYTQQAILNALFRTVEIAGEAGVKNANLLTAIIMSNQLDAITTNEEMRLVEGLIQQLQNQLLNSLQADQPHDKETHEELIHAYVALSKAVEYKRLLAGSSNENNMG